MDGGICVEKPRCRWKYNRIYLKEAGCGFGSTGSEWSPMVDSFKFYHFLEKYFVFSESAEHYGDGHFKT
jgi:hypothetical protein